jgi:hypothetical protein
MNKSILVLVAVFFVGCMESHRIGSLGTPNGRYVFGQVNGFDDEKYVLDVETGRLWHLDEYKNILNVVGYNDRGDKTFYIYPLPDDKNNQ